MIASRRMLRLMLVVVVMILCGYTFWSLDSTPTVSFRPKEPYRGGGGGAPAPINKQPASGNGVSKPANLDQISSNQPPKNTKKGSTKSTAASEPYTDEERSAYLSDFLRKMVRLSPSPELPNLKAKVGLSDDMVNFEEKSLAVTVGNIARYLVVPEGHLKLLQSLHKQLVESLPEAPRNFYKPGRGIVLTGGGAYMAPMLSSVVWLRRKGITEPVEVFMSREEYIADLCDAVLPSYNAQCVLVEDIYGAETLRMFKYMGYPLKVLALLASSYEEAFSMDADSLPITDLDSLFNNDAYKMHEYVLWPDYWPRATISEWYELIGRPLQLPEGANPDETPIFEYKNAIPQAQSSESGQIILNKQKHFKSLLLNLYYNMNGYSQYYPLLTAGAHGEGDKDCFAAAAYVMGEKLYQVRAEPRSLGFFNTRDQFQGRAIVQLDPKADLEYLKAGKLTQDEQRKIPASILHSNGIKTNPKQLYCDDDKTCDRKQRYRFFGPRDGAIENVARDDGIDIELEMFTCLNHVICDVLAVSPTPYAGYEGYDLEAMCRSSKDHIDWLSENADNERVDQT